MSRTSICELRGYLLQGHLSSPGCRFRSFPPALSLRNARLSYNHRPHKPASRQAVTTSARCYPTSASSAPATPFDDPAPSPSKSRPKRPKQGGKHAQVVPGWELTVGIEIHAQLNTRHKLFSRALNAPDSADPPPPNTLVDYFDLALPGSQPVFQPATLIPAIRASLALGCEIQKVSRWDRKHYFHWDQPAGYQITQYYEPLAKNGRVDLFPRDGIAAEEAERAVSVEIQRVQMEQDTAKTLHQPGGIRWIDFNRSGVPLVEIITGPDIHYPATAAALVRKVQSLLFSVDACVSGMEAGGLRADVNVSVRPSDAGPDAPLGTRVEIKNISSFRAVEDAIIAERDRQIALLKNPLGIGIVSETRSWAIGDTVSQRLRGKEGEVDYRYMPDPDLGPVVVGDDVVHHLRSTMGMLPDTEVNDLISSFGMSEKDAMSLLALEGGGRAQFYYNVVAALETRLRGTSLDGAAPASLEGTTHRVLAANWVVHELGKLTSERNTVVGENNSLGMTPEGTCRISANALAEMLCYLLQRRITGEVAKDVLFALFRDGEPDEAAGQDGNEVVKAMLDRDNAWFQDVEPDEYRRLAEFAASENKAMLEVFVDAALKGKKYPTGKLMFLVGQVMRQRNSSGGTSLDAKKVEAALREVVQGHVDGIVGMGV